MQMTCRCNAGISDRESGQRSHISDLNKSLSGRTEFLSINGPIRSQSRHVELGLLHGARLRVVEVASLLAIYSTPFQVLRLSTALMVLTLTPYFFPSCSTFISRLAAPSALICRTAVTSSLLCARFRRRLVTTSGDRSRNDSSELEHRNGELELLLSMCHTNSFVLHGQRYQNCRPVPCEASLPCWGES